MTGLLWMAFVLVLFGALLTVLYGYSRVVRPKDEKKPKRRKPKDQHEGEGEDDHDDTPKALRDDWN